jgi:hypothetical protein
VNIACPYCEKPAVFQPSSAHVYHGRDYGPIYECAPCSAWVGCHPGTDTPLGRLANKELRQAKMAVHAAFDPIWKARYARKHATDPRYTKGMARGGRYKRLAELMGIPREECHIGMFDLAHCQAAIRICKSGELDQ